MNGVNDIYIFRSWKKFCAYDKLLFNKVDTARVYKVDMNLTEMRSINLVQTLDSIS